MTPPPASPTVIRFGSFDLDLANSELRKSGVRLRIQEQPLQVLTALVARPNEVVPREELRSLLWPDGTFVDYERGLNSAVARLRQVLQDSAETPRFIETVARRGYRFIAPLGAIPGQPSTASPGNGTETTPAVSDLAVDTAMATQGTAAITEKQGHNPHASTLRRTIFALVIVIVVAAFYRWFVPDPTPRVNSYTQLTHDARPKAFLNEALPVIVTDGSRIYFTQEGDGAQRSALYQVPQSGGETSAIPTAADTNVEIGDISPDRSRILLQTFDSWVPEMPLWTMPVTGGAPTRLHDLIGRDATWSPDGRMIAFARSNKLYISTASALNTKLLVSANAPIRWPRWAPDGRTLRYSVGNPSGWMRIESVAVDGSRKRTVIGGRDKSCCCGNWTPDANYYVFECQQENRTDLWAVRERPSLFGHASEPVRLTRGPIEFRSVTPSSDGKRLYALGVQKRGQLVSYDMRARRFVPHLGSIAAEGVAASRDGQWYAYISYPDGALWRTRTDGTERLQLTLPPMRANLPQWSPDGRRIAFTAQTESHPWGVYVVSADGGLPEKVFHDNRDQSGPSWSPDGESLAFGRMPWLEDPKHMSGIIVVNLKTKQTSILPGSEHFYSPRWSPDGRYMSALTAVPPMSRMALFNFATQRWQIVNEPPAAYAVWSRDAKYVHFINPYVGRPRLCRLRVSDRSIETLTEIDEHELGWTIAGKWAGLSADGSPLVLRDTSIQEIYALDWHAP